MIKTMGSGGSSSHSFFGLKFCAFALPRSLIFGATRFFAQDSQNRTARTGQVELDCLDRRARTGQPGHESQDRTGRNMTGRTGKAEQVRQTE
jgi:hypothetical protein